MISKEITVTVGIPLYNDPEGLSRALYSICTQTVIPDEVIIVDDCSSCDYTEIINQFTSKLNIRYTKKEKNSGCGVVRQNILDMTETDYLIFLDSDDIFCDVFWVQNVKFYAKTNKADVFVPQFWEQIENLNTMLVSGRSTQPWCHGKAYRIEFIRERNISFPEFRTHEDVGFNGILFWASSNIEYIDLPVYLWIYNKTSITRKSDYMSERYDEYTKACQHTIDWISRNIGNPIGSNCALDYAVAHYVSLLSQKNRQSKEYERNVEIFIQFLKENKLDELIPRGFYGKYESHSEFIRNYNQFVIAAYDTKNQPFKMEETLFEFVDKINERGE